MRSSPERGEVYSFTHPMMIISTCSGYGVVDPETRELKITNAHNHRPDLTLLKKLIVTYFRWYTSLPYNSHVDFRW